MSEVKKILLAGLPAELRPELEQLVSLPDYQVTHCHDPVMSLSLLPDAQASLVLVYAHLPGVPCDQYIRQVHSIRPGLAVVVLAADVSMEHAVKVISAGASDYLVWPVAGEVLQAKLNQLLVSSEHYGLIAQAPATRQAVQLAQRVAKTGATILMTGESGSGKEVFARYVHRCSDRSAKPFVAVNCAAIPETMLESILFGHEKGAFTGAMGRHPGKFEQASGGTLFLDEVAEMPLEQQAKLLRVLQEREVERLGGVSPIPVDVRVIAATNRNLPEQINSGRFRQDLFYRLNVFPMHLEPLRSRREDVIPLARRIINKMSCKSGQPAVQISPQAMEVLQSYDWPGNIRELENVMQRACVLKRGWVIMPEDLMLPAPSSSVTPATGNAPEAAFVADQAEGQVEESNIVGLSTLFERPQLPGTARKQREWQYLIEVLKRNQGQRNRTAEELGMTTRMLRYKLAQLRDAGVDIDALINPVVLAS